MNLLFVCTLNQIRSLTAEQMFKNVSGLSVRSAGTASNARHEVNSKDIDWADIIFVMEKEHQEHLQKKFPDVLPSTKVVNLNIPNGYDYMDPDLMEMLRVEVAHHLGTM